MDFNLSPEQQMFKKAVADFVDKEVVPVAGEIDEAGTFPWPLFRRVGELGFFALRYPEEYGGVSADTISTCILAEELGRGSMSLAACVMMQGLMGTDFIYRFGTEEHKQRCLAPALRGEKIGTIAMTEPNAGSDLGNIATMAVREGDHYRLHGGKTWITQGTVADFFTVLATTDKAKGLKGVAFFLVEKGTPGFTVGRKIEKLGVRASETTELSFDDCRIPVENRLGEEGQGVTYLQAILGEIRVMTAALGLGIARAAFQEGLRYAQERMAFGKPIGKFQLIAAKLADMATELEAARLLTYYAAWLVDQGLPHGKEVSMAKLYATEMANRAADEVCRIFASYGFAMEYAAQRYFRDARFLLSGGGTSELLKVLIAKELGL